mmetsp:Transcript_59013/g.138275  ORF Transcript_59013/g.138275 Transcript_59013/m.138275 type:complete len:102 (+) Transcript_59013:487-792(+)
MHEQGCSWPEHASGKARLDENRAKPSRSGPVQLSFRRATRTSPTANDAMHESRRRWSAEKADKFRWKAWQKQPPGIRVCGPSDAPAGKPTSWCAPAISFTG